MMICILLFTAFYALPLVQSKEQKIAHFQNVPVRRHEQRLHRPLHLRNEVHNLARNSHENSGTSDKHLMRNVLGPRFLALMEEDAETGINWSMIFHIIFSILTLIGSFGLFFLSMWQASKLFSKGIWSEKFLKGGGYWLLAAAGIGSAVGTALGIALYPSFLCYFISGFMMVGASVVYIGRRGAILGTTGGLTAGLALAIMHSGSISASILEGLLCTIAGIIIGFVPIFPNLKMNARYIQQGIRSSNMMQQSTV